MYPRLLPGKPLSESLEPTDRDETLEAVDTERSSWGTAFSASPGVAHGSGEEPRSGGGVGIESMIGRQRGRWMLVVDVLCRREVKCEVVLV